MSKPRALLRRDWNGLRVAVRQAAEAGGISPDDLRMLPVHGDHEQVLGKVRQTFFNKTKPDAAWPDPPVPPEELLPKLIPAEEKAWLLLNETQKERNKFWVYEGRASAVCLILSRVPFDHAWLVCRKYEWMLHITDHDALIAYGAEMSVKLKASADGNFI
ncbi:MAG: hypothetical protein IBJ09_02280 [Bacteroidia bacterium]|nr:hypothetical protein [Bacteroidia bacterium]